MTGINTDAKDNDILIAAVSISLTHASSLGYYSGCCFSSEGHPYSSVWLFLGVRTPITFFQVYLTQFCFCCCLWCCAQSLQSCPTLCNLWPVAHQAPLSMEFSSQEYWSGLPCLPPGDLPNLGIEPIFLASPSLQAVSLPTKPLEKPLLLFSFNQFCSRDTLPY